ncbi:2-oxo acid dehydrogenase subunit E2 [Stappia sp. F7233]|uniref:Dihydrolipoamide acetyltransferase component of pyruvate dehydrogenase complex n=1 Tax=Stappia albiluteola TaxID=2758565 RepID=A0A839AF76_9HYPH|nr:dihydrolipoamide acetyltransferase family protein [Stappia albiluteola]MBA5777542.1 2-oxo acid dehydrogenase subunit E2 [Stappia albiluteola]
MSYEFRLQDPGEGIHEAEIVEILAKEGAMVEEGDNVLAVETDKAVVDISSPVTGRIAEIRVGKGDIVEVGNVLMVFETDEETSAETPADEAETQEKQPEDDKRPEPDREREAEEAEGAGAEEGHEDSAPEPEKGSPPDDGESRGESVKATPAVRGLARELGVDIDEVSPSGKDGRVTERDVRSYAGQDAGDDTSGAGESGEEDRRDDDIAERRSLRSVRRTIARRMAQAWRDIPHVVHHDRVDISALERLRREHEPEIEGVRLTVTPFLMKALAGALREHPEFNAVLDTDNEEILLKKAVNVGVAIDTDRGLMVPVVRDADSKSIAELARELATLSDTVRNQRAKPKMLKGATITLTNIGSIGGTGFSPLISPPQVAIFGAARAELHQVVEGSLDNYDTRIALMLPVCLAFDHRVLDGAQAARFVNTVKRNLADPGALLIHG